MDDEKKKLQEKEDRSDSRRRNEYYGGTYPERAKRNLMSGPQPVHAPQKPEDLHPFLGEREEPEALSGMIDVYAGPEPDQNPPCPVYAGPEPNPKETSGFSRLKSRLFNRSDDTETVCVYAGPEMLEEYVRAESEDDTSMCGVYAGPQTGFVYAGPEYFNRRADENVESMTDPEKEDTFIPDAKAVLCPVCGGIIPANGNFCPECGSPAPKREE